MAKRSDERAGIEHAHQAAHDELVAERNTLAANFEELQGSAETRLPRTRQHLAQVEEQLATRERMLSDRAAEITRLTEERAAALEELEQEQARAAEAAAALVVPEEPAHVLLIPAFTGYMLLERTGPAPEAREVVEIGPGTWGEGRFVVSRTGPSLFPTGPGTAPTSSTRSAQSFGASASASGGSGLITSVGATVARSLRTRARAAASVLSIVRSFASSSSSSAFAAALSSSARPSSA